MSLKIWLPLNGDLTNNGTSNATVTNSGAVITDGKIGKCYTFSAGKIDITDFGSFSDDGFTVCFWARTASTNNWQNIIYFKADDNTNPHNIYFANSPTRVKIEYNPSVNISSDYSVWHHYTYIVKSGKSVGFLDGVQSATSTETWTAKNIVSITLGNTNTATCLNDVRIYDEVLSLSQIYEISKGLICHYKLDHSVNTITNAFNLPTFHTSADAGGWYHWGQSGHSGTYGQNTNKEYIYDKSQPYSHWWADAASATGNYLLYQSPAFAGGYRSLSAILKEENSKPITEDIVYPTWNANVSDGATLNKWTRVIPLGDGFYLGQVDGIHQDGSNDLIGFYIKPGYKVYISQAWLENDKAYCTDVLFPLTQVIDSSGYGYDLVPQGTLTFTTDSGRYGGSLTFDGSASHINNTAMSLPLTGDSTFTYSAWIKWGDASWPSNYPCVVRYGDLSSYNAAALCIYQGKLDLDFWNYRYMQNTATMTVGTWHHVVATKTAGAINTTCKLYVDGTEVVGTGNSAESPNITDSSSKLVIGVLNSATGRWFKGQISDVRIYATALSANDVKKLYNIGMKVDNAQSIHGLEYDETTENLLRTEVIQPYAKSGSTVGIGEWVMRSGVYAMDIRPAPFYNNITVDGVVKSAVLRNELEPNTQYVLDLWIDADDVKNNGTNVAAGLQVVYTDNTSSNVCVTGGNKGFQHIILITNASKSVDRITSYYYVSQPTYYRYDSYIAKVTNTTGTLRTGITRNGQCVEGGDNLTKIGVDGTMHAKEFLEI